MARLTLSFKGKPLTVYSLGSGETTIGRDAANDIRIDSLAVSPIHARIRANEEGFVITAAGATSTLTVNGSNVEEHQFIDNDTVLIGKHTLTFGEAAPAGDLVLPRRAQVAAGGGVPSGWLQILSGERVGKAIRLKAGLTDTGKLGLQPALISRRGDGYFISSLSDENSVKVAGDGINDGTRRLRDGDLIQIGDVKLHFYTEPD